MKESLVKNHENNIRTSYMDNLTGLSNHDFFLYSLEEEIIRSQRYGDPFTLALIDINSFSSYNQRHNQALGDKALRAVADIIRKNFRRPDLVFRFIGDVFALILPKSTAPSSFVAVDRMRKYVEEQMGGELTVSAGLVSYPREASDKTNILDQAKGALKKAKIRGKNNVSYMSEVKTSLSEPKSKILMVDDDPVNIKLLSAIIAPLNHEIYKAYNGEEALSTIRNTDIDLVLLDVMMPVMDGYEVCRRLKKNESTRLIPVVMVTALNDLEARVRGIEAGADDFITKPPNQVELTARVTSLLKMSQLNKKLTSIENVLISMTNAVEAKDVYTQGHSQRVSDMAISLGKKMELSTTEIDVIRLGGILHDIGKIGIPREILHKAGALNCEEWEVIKKHPSAAYRICLPLEKTLGPALDAIRHHHEKMDGSGYPEGIKEEEISILARIITVVDIFDSLNTDRPYRNALSKEETFEILGKEVEQGKIDGTVVGHLMDLLNS